MISEAQIGDRVLSYSVNKKEFVYSDIVWIPHAKNSDAAKFNKISTEKGEELILTPDHLITSGDCCDATNSVSLIRAKQMTVGTCVLTIHGMDKVVEVTTVDGNGLYSVITNEEYVVVNDIVASPFAVNHFAVNQFYNIHRTLYKLFPMSFWTNSPAMKFVNFVAQEISVVFADFILKV